MNEVQKLSKVFENLGAQSTQALTMARQVLRRADQLAEEKNISRIDSLERLMRLCVRGFQGEISPDFTPTRKKSEKNKKKTDLGLTRFPPVSQK